MDKTICKHIIFTYFASFHFWRLAFHLLSVKMIGNVCVWIWFAFKMLRKFSVYCENFHHNIFFSSFREPYCRCNSKIADFLRFNIIEESVAKANEKSEYIILATVHANALKTLSFLQEWGKNSSENEWKIASACFFHWKLQRNTQTAATS